MAKSSDNIRCIRKYPKKDGTHTFHAEVRRKGAKLSIPATSGIWFLNHPGTDSYGIRV